VTNRRLLKAEPYRFLIGSTSGSSTGFLLGYGLLGSAGTLQKQALRKLLLEKFPSLETFQARLDGALSTPIQLQMFLLTAEG